MKKIIFFSFIIILKTFASQSDNYNKINDNSKELKTLYFDYNKPVLTHIHDLKHNIQLIKEMLKDKPDTKFIVEGYASRNFEQPFDRKEQRYVASYIRAKVIVDELIRNNIPANILKLVPKGNNFAKYIPLPDEDEISYSKRSTPDRKVKIKVFKPEDFTPGSDISGLKG